MKVAVLRRASWPNAIPALFPGRTDGERMKGNFMYD